MQVREDLIATLTQTKVVLLLDDSGSMNERILAPGESPFAPQKSTRWSELQGEVANIVQLVTAVSLEGVDVHFMNRSGLRGVTDQFQLVEVFQNPPNGDTPMVSSLTGLYTQYRDYPGCVLIILVTDGEPSDANYDALKNALNDKPRNVYISLVECNDNEEEMDYLTGWDLTIPRFHNQEDYPEELRLVRMVQGQATAPQP